MIKLILIQILLFLIPHPLHLSVTNLDYDQPGEQCQLTLKVFSNDFADLLREREGPQALSGRDSLQLMDSLLFVPLLQEKVNIRLDGITQPLRDWHLDSVSNNFEASWLYFSLPYTGRFEEVSVRNSVFFDVYSDQRNLLFISKDDQEKAFRLSHKNPIMTVRFD